MVSLSGWGSSPLTRGKRLAVVAARRCDGLIPAHAGKTEDERAGRGATGAHPRSRGENAVIDTLIADREGSSPLTRGKQRRVDASRARAGLIPAHAGKTPLRNKACAGEGAHPRSRGENVVTCCHAAAGAGSSPLTRGKHLPCLGTSGRSGLIPAHAGKTTSGARRVMRLGAHPRSRGENYSRPGRKPDFSGSSPLTRGKPPAHAAPTTDTRLIPAHAGKTDGDGHLHGPRGAHPRSRGENVGDEAMRPVAPGSSPLTRGKRGDDLHSRVAAGLIPAHAGKTRGCATRPGLVRAHPRSRGENHPAPRGPRTPLWLIPAHAGKTVVGRVAAAFGGAHPRSRGENGVSPVVPTNHLGSSPLTRGKRRRARVCMICDRLIPAHAGKTKGSRAAHSQPWAHPRSRGENWLAR